MKQCNVRAKKIPHKATSYLRILSCYE